MPNLSGSTRSSSGDEDTPRSGSGSVPAGTDVKQRMLSRSLADDAKTQHRYWYKIGRRMMEEGLEGPEAKKLIERDGNVVHWSPSYLRGMRLAVETIVGTGIEDQKISQCPFRFASHVMRHLRTGEISEAEAINIVDHRSRHLGSPKELPFRKVESKEGIQELANRFT